MGLQQMSQVFSDGSAVILHPTPMAAVTFFSATGERQRLLSSCVLDLKHGDVCFVDRLQVT